jgi:pyruvyltransferase
VSGPRTRLRALECGAVCPEVYGDPGLLLPRFYTPAPAQRSGIGLVPHFSDMPRLAGRRWPDLRLIDIQDPIERVIDQIAACELVASSSLHGIIAAHAYGVPAVWLKFRDLPSGDDSKFIDYQRSFGAARDPVRVTDDRIDPATFGPPIPPPSPTFADALWDACPLR